MIINSYSKINLFLLVSKKQKNNLHKIKSLFLLNKDLYDEINIEKSNDLSIKYIYKNKNINIDNCNVQKILYEIKDKYKIDINYKIIINKNIPFSSGLGGSSSNAAYVVKYILDSLKIEYMNDYLFFSMIGSDIPFFLSGYDSAIVYNYGDKIKKKYININYELFLNDIQISSKNIFDEFDKYRGFNILRNYTLQMMFIRLKLYRYLYNDLQSISLKYDDALQEIYSCLPIKEYKFILSGSGSSFIKLKI